MNKFFLLGLGLSIIGLNVFADHTTQQRSNCRILPKYKAVAKLKAPGATFYTNNTNTGCTWAEAAVSSDWSNSNSDGYSYCYIGNSGFSAWGRGYRGWSYGENTTLVTPEYSFAPMIVSKNNSDDDANNTKNGYKGDGVVFDAKNRTITIQNLTAYLGVSSHDIKNDYSTLQFKIFSETIKDGKSIPVKTLWSAKVTLINGELLLEGDFTKSDFENNSYGEEVNFTLNATTKTIRIDKDIDFETLVVEMSGDGGNLGIGISKDYAPNLTTIEGQAIKNKIISETNFNFDIVNKTSEIEIIITKNKNNSKIEEATIFSFDGKAIKSIELSDNNYSNVVNVSNLSKGAYFIRFLIEGNYYSKKFIVF